MALTGPNRAPSGGKSPRVWQALGGSSPTVSIWQRAVVGRYPSGSNAGYINNIGADPELVVVGLARNNCGVVPTGHTATFANQTIVDEEIVVLNFPNADASTAVRDQLVYAVDENSASTTPTGYAPIGAFWEYISSTQAVVGVGPSYVARAMAASAAGGASATSSGFARAVATNLGGTATYVAGIITGPSNTALPAQDGVTIAVGNVLFLGKWLSNLPAAAQAGPWEVTSLGSGSSQYTLERPTWWLSGASLPSESTIKVGPEGASLADSRWTSTAAPGGTVDTTDPAFVFDGGPLIAGGIPSTHTVRGVVTVNESLTAFDSVSAGTIRDGVTYVAGDIVLLVNQTTASQNGPYVVGPVATGSAPLSRPAWWETGAKAQPGYLFSVSEGTQGKNSQWILRTSGPIIIDTTSVNIDMIGGNWVQGVSTAIGTQAAPSSVFIAAALLTPRLSGIFEVELDVGWSSGTTADSVTWSLITDTSASGALAGANNVHHGVAGFGAYASNDWESSDTNSGAAVTYNGAAFSTAPVTQASEVIPSITGLLSGSAQHFSFKGYVDNASPSGTTKTPFTIGNTVAFGVSVSASHTITVPTLRMTVRELPAQ